MTFERQIRPDTTRGTRVCGRLSTMTGGDRQSQLTVADTFWFKYTLSALAAVVAESGIMLVFLKFRCNFFYIRPKSKDN